MNFRLKKSLIVFSKKVLLELFIGIVAGCSASFLFIHLNNRSKEIVLMNNLNSIKITYSENYIKQLYCEPIVSFEEGGLTNSYYNINHYVLRCVYDNKQVVAYIVYMNPSKKSKKYYFCLNEFNNFIKPLGTFTYYEFDSELPTRSNANVAAVGAGYNYYEELIYSGNFGNYNYYILGNYLDNNEYYNSMLNLFLRNNYNNVESDPEYSLLRKKIMPNVYGVIKSGYEDVISLITSNAREFDRILAW